MGVDNHMNYLQKVILWIVKIGIFVIPFLPLYISASMLFPFITGKNFTFRIIIEIVFALWAGLAVANPEYRPRLTRLFKAVTIFVVIVFLADLFSPNPYRSFFSNFERMEGFMMIGHLYLYFLVLSSVFRKRDWLIFFHSNAVASLFVSYIGLMQKFGLRVSMQGGFRVDSTIGNPTYLAAYLLFNVWIFLLLMYLFRKHWWAVALYGAAAAFELMIVYFTATRGAMLGLVAASLFLAVSLVIWWPRIFAGAADKGIARAAWPWGRKFACVGLVMVILLPFSLWLASGSSFVKSNQVLRRITSYSFQEDTIQARFRIWKMSAKGVLERPILGWGQENYYLVFQKQYDPGLYSQEPWFDRSHNFFFDWLIHAGILGLLSYLAMIGAAFWGIIAGIRYGARVPARQQEFSFPVLQGFILMAGFGAHVVQNIFVFDNLNTYLPFFGLLAYSLYLVSTYAQPIEMGVGAVGPVQAGSNGPGSNGMNAAPIRTAARGAAAQRNHIQSVADTRSFAVMAGLLIVVAISSFYLHVQPIRQSKGLVAALMQYQSKGKMDDLIGGFKAALAYDSLGTTEVREQIANIGLSMGNLEHYTNDEKKKFIQFAVDELKKETAHNAKDVKHLLFLGAILNRSLDYNPAYISEAEHALTTAATMSPGKQTIAFELAQFYALTGKAEKAGEILRAAWRLDKSYRDAAVTYWTVAILAKNAEMVHEVASETDVTRLREPDLYRIAEAYRQVGDFNSGLMIYEQIVVESPTNPRYHATLAALYAHAGRKEEARNHALKAAELDASFKGEAEQFIKQLGLE